MDTCAAVRTRILMGMGQMAFMKKVHQVRLSRHVLSTSDLDSYFPKDKVMLWITKLKHTSRYGKQYGDFRVQYKVYLKTSFHSSFH